MTCDKSLMAIMTGLLTLPEPKPLLWYVPSAMRTTVSEVTISAARINV